MDKGSNEIIIIDEAKDIDPYKMYEEAKIQTLEFEKRLKAADEFEYYLWMAHKVHREYRQRNAPEDNSYYKWLMSHFKRISVRDLLMESIELANS